LGGVVFVFKPCVHGEPRFLPPGRRWLYWGQLFPGSFFRMRRTLKSLCWLLASVLAVLAIPLRSPPAPPPSMPLRKNLEKSRSRQDEEHW
jgi:hypothetical protein